ncbi:MAG: hypothetical protein KDD44_04125 [Bdellovibrionales bacterium]|nr:hypothetical protein [Bdellovibrionales bacterium]
MPYKRLISWMLLLGSLLVPIVVAAQLPWIPYPRFPDNSDQAAFNAAQASMNQVINSLGQSSSGFAGGIGQDYSSTGSWFNSTSGRYSVHPWVGNWTGRNFGDTLIDWADDGLRMVGAPSLSGSYSPIDDFKRFMECMQPQLILPICLWCMPPSARFDGSWSSCPYRNNLGYVFEYWWPENEIEINNYGVSAFNPILGLRPDLVKPLLTTVHGLTLQLLTDGTMQLKGGVGAQSSFPSGLRSSPHLGQSHHAGLLPGDQTQQVEAHVYQTRPQNTAALLRDDDEGEFDFIWAKVKILYIEFCVPSYLFWYNGYKKGNFRCFYSTIDKQELPVNLWTEDIMVNFFWRYPELSLLIDPQLYWASSPTFIPGSPSGMIIEGQTIIANFPSIRSCAAYRADVWPNRYSDLEHAFGYLPWALPGIIPNTWFSGRDEICYRGGGELYPVTGKMIGYFSPLPAAAYFARRALYLSEQYGINQTNIFNEDVDKLQRIYPGISDCFKVNDIDDTNLGLFPKNIIRPDQMGSIRYVHWNLRVACVCQYRGVYPAPLPFNFVFWLIPQGQGCHNYLNEDDESRGDEYGNGEQALLPPFPPWPYLWPLPYSEAAAQLWPFI